MPRKHKKQDERVDKKRKREQGIEAIDDDELADSSWPVPKRRRSPDYDDYKDLKDGHDDDQYGDDDQDPNVHRGTATQEQYAGDQDEFYGLLNDDDQAYFKRIEAMLELDQFEAPEDKSLFLDSVWREADGKELKLACSQSCSRVLERLLKVSRSIHLKRLFRKFNSHFLFLFQHRFASHCCETLFVCAAPVVTQELVAPLAPEPQDGEDSDEVYVSMENLFLYTVNEIAENTGFLMNDPFGSHVLRVLLVALCGMPSEDSTVRSPPAGKSKDLGIKTWRSVPSSFHEAVRTIHTRIIGGLDTHYLRTLTLNPLASQIFQLLIRLQFTSSSKMGSSEDSLYRRLVPENSPDEDSESGRFLKGLLYDAAGSRLLESIVLYTPPKTFHQLYRSFFAPQVAAMAKNDIASFVLVRIIERTYEEDAEELAKVLEPNMPILLARNRHAIIRAMLERSRTMLSQTRDPDVKYPIDALERHYGEPGPETLSKLLLLEAPDTSRPPPDMDPSIADPDAPTINLSAAKYHARLLAESMLQRPDAACAYIVTCLLATPTPTLLAMARDRHATHVLQTALTIGLDPKPLRNLVQRLGPHAPQLATDPIGAYFVDALWQGTDGPLFFLKERIAGWLKESEKEVRETVPGRAVWRNWRIELFDRRRVEWIAKAKGNREEAGLSAHAGAVTPQIGLKQDGNLSNEKINTASAEKGAPNVEGKSAIELARERWAAKQQRGGGIPGRGRGRGQDARVVRMR